MDELFIGSAICEVTSGGEILLPLAFHQTARTRSQEGDLLVGLHEESSCLIVYDKGVAAQAHYDNERRRAAFLGTNLEEHYSRQRRMYGFVEQVTLAPDGMMVLPSLIRERGRIGGAALLVATGERFEIWDLDFVLERGPSDLVTLATLHLKQHLANEEHHDISLPRPDAPHRAPVIAQSGVRVQAVSPVRPRHDPVDRTAEIK
jgi:DNA-binding transcriptional regulator/RsmH inhibitor MraZ